MFKATAARLYKLIGSVKLSDLPSEWSGAVDSALTRAESEYPKFVNAEIKGSQPHKSTMDKDDSEDVISIRLKDTDMKRVDTIHVHKDGSATSRNEIL